MPKAYAFAGFILDLERRVLLRDGEAVRLGGRALDILGVLAGRAGETVSLGDIMKGVWRDRTADPGALRVHMSALRKALGDSAADPRFIVNDAGRGYRFIMPVADPASPAADLWPPALPAPLTRLIGREESLALLAAKLAGDRLVTIVGPGGIGKTRLALAAAEEAAGAFDGGAWFIDLAAITDPGRVATRIAAELRVRATEDDDALGLVCARLGDRRLLLVLDNCEHVVSEAAAAADRLLRACAGVVLLATSREALRVEGEALHHATVLPYPPPGARPNAEHASAYPAVRLFIERSRALGGGYALTDATAPKVAELCRRLDGLPLAIELAAASLPAFGIDSLIAALDGSLAMLAQGRRTLRRHQTLRAMLDWSVDLLPDFDRRALFRLSILRGWFPREAADAIAGVEGDPEPMTAAIANLVAKSLLLAETDGDEHRYRLLDTTRAHAFERLQAGGEMPETVCRNIAYQQRRLARAAAEWTTRPRSDWWLHYGGFLKDIEVALGHVFAGSSGDLRAGLALIGASTPLWLGMSRLRAFEGVLALAVERLEALRARDPGAARDLRREEIQLLMLQATVIFARDGPNAAERTALERARSLADELGDPAAAILALWGLSTVAIALGDYREAERIAADLGALIAARGDERAAPLGERVAALTRHRLGDQEGAERLSWRVPGMRRTDRDSLRATYLWDHVTAARANLSGVLFMRGAPAAARRMSDEAVTDGIAARNPTALCYILAYTACPLRLWLGDEVGAAEHLRLLRDVAGENGFRYLLDWADRYDGAIDLRRGADTAHARSLRARFPDLRELDREILFSVAPALLDDVLLDRIERDPANWIAPEVLRSVAATRADEAAPLLVRAADLAQAQGARTFELRAVADLVARAAADRDAAADEARLQRIVTELPEPDARWSLAPATPAAFGR